MSSPSASKPRSKLKTIRQPGRPIVRIGTEPFLVEHDGDSYFLRHEKWSLVGAGDSVFTAYKDLLREASELAAAMHDIPMATMDQEAAKLYRFVLRIA